MEAREDEHCHRACTQRRASHCRSYVTTHFVLPRGVPRCKWSRMRPRSRRRRTCGFPAYAMSQFVGSPCSRCRSVDLISDTAVRASATSEFARSVFLAFHAASRRHMAMPMNIARHDERSQIKSIQCVSCALACNSNVAYEQCCRRCRGDACVSCECFERQCALSSLLPYQVAAVRDCMRLSHCNAGHVVIFMSIIDDIVAITESGIAPLFLPLLR